MHIVLRHYFRVESVGQSQGPTAGCSKRVGDCLNWINIQILSYIIKMSQLENLMKDVQDIYLRVNQNFKLIIDNDPTVLREDSAKGLLSLIRDIRTILASVNRLSIEERAKHFNLTYNALVYISDIASLLRKSNYCFETVKQLLDCVLSMEANIILNDVKYLDKRSKIYLDICHIYEENEYLEPAIALLDSALQKYKQLKAIHEMDPPLPLHVETIINNNIRILKVVWLKYCVQMGTINPNDWRKKVDEEFGDDISLKLLSLIECLRTETRKQSNIFQKSQHTSFNKGFKQVLLQAGYDMVKPYLDIIHKSLNEQKAKIEREVTFKNTQDLTQELINQEIKKKREIEEKNVKIGDFKKASSNFPFEYHAELIHYAYQVKNNKILVSLLQTAMLRSECRRIQMPYINDVGIIASSTMNPNIPNGYEKIPTDLNEANLKIELKKLRKKNQGRGGEEEKAVGDQKDPKDNKKGAKDPKAAEKEEPKKQNKDMPTEWELQQINHKYVYMIVKRTMSPENAVYDMNIVMGDEEEGPAGYMDTRRIIVPYIQENMNVQQSKVKQYKGIKETSSMVPYIIMKHSKTGLEDEEQRKGVIIDVKPLIGKNPIMPPSWGYQKIPIDLRQVPEQFLKNSNHDYVYITFKTDSLFFSSQRHVKILSSLTDLENAQINLKPENSQDEKLLQLGINYNLEKLNCLFLCLQECLDGKLGQDFYILKCDFLTHLAYHIWTKYLRGPLVQFDYVNEMRLNEQLIDYDYQFYRDAIRKCKPIFLNGVKVLNFIMVNNPKSDVLLLSRINLELLKLLEEEKEYKQAFQNARMSLDRIRQYRDQYLGQGLRGNQNRLLPFSLTCSNTKIKDTLAKMQEKFKEQRDYIRKLKRVEERKSKDNQKQMSQEELQEEENEFKHYQKKDEIDEIIQKVGSSHPQIISVLAAAELDVYNIYFRTVLKHAQHLKIVEKHSSNNVINGIKQSTMEGLATSMKNKLSLMYGKSQQKNQKNLKDLQTTLIQAEKLPPPKPGLHWVEKKTIEQFQKNPYAMALLMANFAAMNSQSEDKKYFLQQGMECIKKCLEEEKNGCEEAIRNSIFIYSTLWDDSIKPEASSSAVSPFKELYDGTWPSVGQVPTQPILVSKNSTQISMKIPPYAIASDGKKRRRVKSMSLYGKPSANGVDVSTNCNELQGTGLKNRVDEVVKVTDLKPNNVYCFAVAAKNDEEGNEPIGRTCGDILTSNPLPIPMLASYISKISYQINEYDMAYNAAKIVIDEICELSFYKTPFSTANHVYTYKLKQSALNTMSLLEIRSVVETLYIMALCERKKLLELKATAKEIVPILTQEKEQKITNWLMLASLLNPCLTSPLVSIPFLIPEDFIVLKALSLSLIPPKWMNSKLRQVGVKVMEKVLKWGLEKNQIGLARRIVYRWTQRKWLMLGKVIQIEEKKDIKKGAKDSKDQQVKLIDKYCRILLQKAPGLVELFEDSLAVVSEEYSDFTNLFIERAKQQITYFSQFVENPPEELQGWTNRLNSKIQLSEYLKDPLNNIKKVGQASPFYLEFNCKILRRALEVSTPADLKQIQAKSQELVVPSGTKQIVLSKEIQSLMLQAISNNYEWIPSAKKDIMRLQQKTGKNLSKQIKIYDDFEAKMGELTKNVSKMDALVEKHNDFDYLNIWLSELQYLKATIAIMNCSSFVVKNQAKGRFDKVRLMNLEDLLKKKKEMEILDKQSICYSQQELKILNEILKMLCDAAYSSFCIENWVKLQNVFRLLFNLINKLLITPFCHKQNNIWQYFAFLSLLAILMLKRIRAEGFETFRKRYKTKQSRTELKIVASKLALELPAEQMVQIFEPTYFMPELDPNTTKNYWFQKQPRIDLEAMSSLLAYTVQTLRLENKYNLVINLSRDFCNATQHYHSLEFLPFMIESQQKLIDEVKESIDKENGSLNELVSEFTKKKSSKMKGQRQHKLTNEPLPYEIQYEEKRKKILDSLELLSNHRSYLQAQIESSQLIIEEIKRDTSKTVLKQREQCKFMAEFGDDEEHMFKNYGDDTRLAKNRKNAVKDIIEQYDKIYRELKNNKTSKDPLAEIQNRNEVGNLYFAIGSYEKAGEFWEDALATIFKTVRPVENYLQIFRQNKSFLVSAVGQKETVLSINLLYKIAKYGSFKKLYYQYNCTKFAGRLAMSLLETDSKHPPTLLGHASYRLLRFSNGDSLEDEATINLSQLINSLQFFACRIIDMGNSIQSLPVLNLYEHIATDVVKNIECSVRAKLLKGIALANCGLISESLSYLTKIVNQKDLPNIWIDPSDQMKREKGCNWCLEEVNFDNSKPWSDAANKEAVDYIKKVALKNDFVTHYGLATVPLVNYLRGLILTKIFSQEIWDNFDTNQIRITNIQEAEAIMRDSLKKLSILQEHYANLEDIEKSKLKLNKNEINDDAEKALQQAKTAAIAHLKANGIEEALVQRYLAEKPTALKKVYRLEFMARIRYSIHESYSFRRLNSNSFHVLKNALTNLHRISYGSRKVETGYDPEIAAAQPQPAPTGKKDDKKGGKKEEQNLEVPKQQINWEKEVQKQKKAEESSMRVSINIFWHLKLTYEMGKLVYHQNNFRNCKSIFEQLVAQARQYEQHYFFIFAQAYILRCELRLGKFDLPKFNQIIGLAYQREYERQDLIDLVMDLGEILKGEESIKYFEKGCNISAKLWGEQGMNSQLNGIDAENLARMFSSKQELGPEQEEEIKRKSRKVDKKGGKDDKKAAKKEDPKKKKEETKAEYKVEPLAKYEWWNLLDQEKHTYENYMLRPHPNFNPNNIYCLLSLQYIKCYTRHLEASIEHKFELGLLEESTKIGKLIKIVESFPVNGYYYLVQLYYCAAELEKNAFVIKLKDLLANSKDKKLKKPFEDLPLNQDLIALPLYSQFIFDNRQHLEAAEGHYKKLVGLFKGNCLLFDNALKLDEILWRAADNQLYLAEYRGRSRPKFYQFPNPADSENHSRLQCLNQIGEAAHLIDLSIKVVSCLREISSNYTELGSKPLQATAKLDQDIVQQINDIDLQFKSSYSKILAESLKPKTNINALELITYLAKVHRESEFMAFSNSSIQNVLLRCHRMLLSGCLAYKDKCIITNVDYAPKKALDDKFIEIAAVYMKSRIHGDNEQFVYVLGGQDKQSRPYYGRVSMKSVALSTICQKLHQIRSKVVISEKKSEAIKNRDFLVYERELKQVLVEIGKKFSPEVREVEAKKISLINENITALIRMLQESGSNLVNKEINALFRHLHELKYKPG